MTKILEQRPESPAAAAFARGDVDALASIFYGIYDRITDHGHALANVVVAPADENGDPDWKKAHPSNLEQPSSDSGPADMAEVKRWAVLVDDISGCDDATSILVWLDAETGQPHMAQIEGPEADADIAMRIIGRDIGAAPPPKEIKLGPLASSRAQFIEKRAPANDNVPIDPWATRDSPPLPSGLLPVIIEEFATSQAELMGADPGGIAMAALAVCAAAVPDKISIQPKVHDDSWLESARLWVALIGTPSTKKSPIISVVTRPLKEIDRQLYQSHAEAKERYEALDAKQRKASDRPRQTRIRLDDVTIEAAQEVLKDSPDGVLLVQDELSGWFGSMEKYSGGGRGAAKDRAFWLQSFNGGSYTVNRVGRGATWIPNLSVSLLGGIQPEPIRAVARDSHDDGLLQRLFPIVLKSAQPGRDAPMPATRREYDDLVQRLHALRQPTRGKWCAAPLRFTADAQRVWQRVCERNFELQAAWELVNVKLAAHIGKLDGLFARLCLLWHCIETDSGAPTLQVSVHVAERVERFMREFLLPHSIAFYTDILGLSDRADEILATAGWILAHRPETVTVRDVRRGDAVMRKLSSQEAEAVLEQLDALGWLEPVPTIRRDSRSWRVNNSVYIIFEEKANEEAYRRMVARNIIADSVKLQC